MSQRQGEGSGQSRRLWLVVLVTAVLSVAATAVAVGALAVAMRGPDPAGCETVAWQAIPDAAALPSGWSMVANQVFVDSLSTSLAGPTPSGSTQRQAAFTGVSCFGSDAGLALRRAHEGALAAGGADVSFATVGDESFVVFSPAASTTTLYFRRGPLVADLTVPTSVDRSTLEPSAGRWMRPMVRSLAVDLRRVSAAPAVLDRTGSLRGAGRREPISICGESGAERESRRSESRRARPRATAAVPRRHDLPGDPERARDHRPRDRRGEPGAPGIAQEPRQDACGSPDRRGVRPHGRARPAPVRLPGRGCRPNGAGEGRDREPAVEHRRPGNELAGDDRGTTRSRRSPTRRARRRTSTCSTGSCTRSRPATRASSPPCSAS